MQAGTQQPPLGPGLRAGRVSRQGPRGVRLFLGAASVLALVLVPAACTAHSGRSGAGTTSGGGDLSRHRGGTLTVDSSSAYGTMDPQISYDVQPWQIAQGVYDGLVAFKKVNGEASNEVVPDLATTLPTVSKDGLTYTFTLRTGIKFSNGQSLRTDDVVASLRRIYKASGPTAGTFFQYIVGATECLNKPSTCTLPGVSADARANTVTIRLTQADSEFLYKLATPHASILPAATPDVDQGIKPIPGTGAYLISAYDPNTHLVMQRNPYFHQWSADSQPDGYPDKIYYRYGLTVEAEVTQVEQGQADWVDDPIPADRLNELGTKYASQVHINPLPAMWYLPLNVTIAPFNNVLARQAVEWAVDRSAVVQQYGGTNLATPLCTVLPPNYPAHVDYCAYTKGGDTTWSAPDMAKARDLVQQSGTAGQSVSLVVSNDEKNLAIGNYLVSVLNQMGYQAKLKPLSSNIQFNYIQNTKNHVQISLTGWYEDYPAPSDFLNVLLSCASFHPGSDSSPNVGGFCDRSFDASMNRALGMEQSDPAGARTLWGQLDRDAMRQAALVPLFTPKNVDLISARTGNYLFTNEYYLLPYLMWVK